MKKQQAKAVEKKQTVIQKIVQIKNEAKQKIQESRRKAYGHTEITSAG